jgi:hypothetical protein
MIEQIQKRTYGVFWNAILDLAVDQWWKVNRIKTNLLIVVQRGIVQGKSWVAIYPKNGNIEFEPIPFREMPEDPAAETRESRRYIQRVKFYRTRDIEEMFDLKPGTIQADGDYSGLIEERKDISDEEKYKCPQACVVEAWYKDNSKGADGKPIYPHGRMIVFVMGQRTDNGTGILKIDDYAWPYAECKFQDYIPHPTKGTQGVPIPRIIEAFDAIATRTGQQGSDNLETCGAAKVFYKRDEVNAEELSNISGEKLGVENPDSYQFVSPQPVTEEAQSFYAFLSNITDMAISLHDVSQGGRPDARASGKLVEALKSSDIRAARPFIDALYDFLTPIGRLFGQMLLEVAGPGYRIRYGEGFRSIYEMPFSMYYVIEDVECFVGQDTEMQLDPVSQQDFLSKIGDRIPLKVLLANVPLDNKEEILQQVDELAAAQQQLQQAQQVIQQLQTELDNTNAEADALHKQNQTMMIQAQGKVVDNEYAMKKQEVQTAVTLQREKMRQDSNDKRQEDQHAAQIATKLIETKSKWDIASLKEKSAGGRGKGESDKSGGRR